MKGNTKAEAKHPLYGSVKYDGVRLVVTVNKFGVIVETSHGKKTRFKVIRTVYVYLT